MTTISTTHKTRSNALHIALWIAQVLVAGMFIMAGTMKTFTSIDELSATIPWVKDYAVFIRFIGITELLGAIGLILPAVLKNAPRLTVWAAYGTTLTMVLAVLFHVVRGEISAIAIPLVLALLSAFIAWGRSTQAPIKV